MSSETRPVSIPPGGHPDENQLLLAIERELPSDEFADVEQHVGACWSCRARSDEMRRGILAFVEYREQRYLPLVPAPPDDFRSLPDRLRAIGHENRTAGLFVRTWRRFTDLFAVPREFGFAGAVAVIMAFLLFWTEVLHPPVMSAHELLARSVAAQSGGATETPARPKFVRQKVRIRNAGKSVIREFKWMAGSPAASGAWSAESDPTKWTSPLTAQAFAQWRDSLRDKQDEIQTTDDVVTLRTTTREHAIREATIDIRRVDFKPVKQRLRFADGQELELLELGFHFEEPQPVTESRPVAPPKEEVSRVELAPLDDVELEARHALFMDRLDVGEDLSITQGSDSVIVSGVVSTREREAAMREALSTIQGVRISFRAPDATSGGDSKAIMAPQSGSQALPLLRQALETAFPSREDRLAFVDRCLAQSDLQLSHAWALKRLLERYPQGSELRLSAGSRAKLLDMLRTHIEQISRHTPDLRLIDLLPASAATNVGAPRNWREAASMLFPEVRHQDSLIARLVAGTQDHAVDLETASAGLRSTSRRIKELSRLALADLPSNFN